MARFLGNQDFIQACREDNRKVDLKVWIDWFGDGQLDTIESADDEIIKLDISRELEGEVSQAILDQGTLVLDNSNNDYSPKSLASRFNKDLGEQNEFNVIPNRNIMIDLSVNGSEFVHYYSGIITNIEPNYDNSRVSITIEDEMLALENFTAPDHLFIEENAKDVIAYLLETTTIDYDPSLIDDINYQITYNFYEEGSIFDALNLIAEMVWGKFFVVEDKLRFINFKTLDQPNASIVETISDDKFLNNGYGEVYSSQDLYTTVELDSNPLQYTSEELQMIWTGSEKQSRVTEEYLGSDLDGNQLQLTTSDGAIEQPTNNVPIAENSLTVSFGDKTYITNYDMNSGIESVNWDTGLITFKNTAEFPLPSVNQTITVNYNFFVLTIPPRRADGTPYEKEIIAEFENPATDIQPIEDYIKFQATNLDYDITYASYKESITKSVLTSAGSNTSETITLSPDASTITLNGYATHYEKDFKWGLFSSGTEYGNANTYVDVLVNGSVQKTITAHSGGRGGSNFRVDKIAVPSNANIQIRHRFDGDGEKENKSQIYNLSLTVGETIVDEITSEIQNVQVEQYNFPDKRKTKLTFINNSDTEVSVYSEYKGKDIDNIYLLGRPLKRTNPIHIEKTNENANLAFSYMGKTLSIQNDLYQNQSRMSETVDFLLDYHSTPRTILNVPIRGLGHIDLMDKVHIIRDEADIDNEFFIKVIEESFTEEGEWNQTLELIQAKSSAWQYDSEGFNTIVARGSIGDNESRDRPPQISNLNLSLTTRSSGNSSYPAIKATWDTNRFSRFHQVYIKREFDLDWELLIRTEDTFHIFDNVFDRDYYQIKVVSEGYNGLLSEFSTAPTEEIQYLGAEIIPNSDISLSETSRKVQKGNYVPVINVEVSQYLDEYFDRLQIYYKQEGESEWVLDGTTTNLSYEILAVELGYYYIKVVPIDKHGNSPDFDSIDSLLFEVVGNKDLPSQVEIDNIYWGADYIEITWKPHPDEDFDEYELRKDPYFGE